jgi:phage-related protein
MAIGFDVGGSLGTVIPDKTMNTSNTPRVHIAKFGDGYEQRIGNGINNLEQEYSVAFTTRAKADIDDIVAFFETKAGVTSFDFVVPDSNESGNELSVKVVCSEWNQTWVNDNFYSLNATFRRVYEV